MEGPRITFGPEGFLINGFPNAVKFVNVEHPKAKKLIDLTLHRHDLDFAAKCLDEIRSRQSPVERPSIVARALWQSAVVSFLKCFGKSKCRVRLMAEQVYKSEPRIALECFKYFKDIRDKHIVHDENTLAQCHVGAVINQRDQPNKIAKVMSFAAFGDTLEQDAFSTLTLAIQKALAWVIAEADQLADAIASDLERESYDVLYGRESVVYTKPVVDDVGKNRNGSKS